jgi:hypothetical protein
MGLVRHIIEDARCMGWMEMKGRQFPDGPFVFATERGGSFTMDAINLSASTRVPASPSGSTLTRCGTTVANGRCFGRRCREIQATREACRVQRKSVYRCVETPEA